MCAYKKKKIIKTEIEHKKFMNDRYEPDAMFIDVTSYIQPGIFRIECTVTKSSLFQEHRSLLAGIESFQESLLNSTCPYSEILDDFKTYGLDSFKYYFLAYGNSFYNDDFRKQELLKFQEAWPGFLYVK
jgi:hypothetical protein